MIGGSAESWEWDHEMAYLKMEDGLYKAKIADCVKCTYVSRDEIEACLDESWVKEE